MKIDSSLNASLKFGLVLFLPLICLLWTIPIHFFSNTIIGHVLQSTYAVLAEPSTQWMLFTCANLYFFINILHQCRQPFLNSRFGDNLTLLLAPAFIISTFVYGFNYSSAAQSMNAVALILGAVFGKGIKTWTFLKKGFYKISSATFSIMLLLVIFQVMDSLIDHKGASRNGLLGYRYMERIRWIGSSGNPNTYGLLMGTGLLLAIGLGLVNYTNSSKKCAMIILCCLSSALTVRGLLHSYSRGAWVAASVGLGYMLLHMAQSSACNAQRFWGRGSRVACWTRNYLPACIVLVSTFTLLFWHFRQTEWQPGRRIFSAINTVDFSWRNRIAAVIGALQIMAEHPLFGTGWNVPGPLYETFYLSPKLTENSAIYTNDYCILGSTLGIPALFCFGMYLWFKFRPDPGCNLKLQDLNWLKITCRAGAIVLLVGFWFDGGLFNLSTATIFWVLLELGDVVSQEQNQGIHAPIFE